MDITGWKYYNHAAIPTTPPHKEPDLIPVKDKTIWSLDGKSPLLARWITDFDCGYETDWWYVIKDGPFDIDALKAKRRYEINKGIKNFDVKIINPQEYKNELYNVQSAAYMGYPPKYRPVLDKNDFIRRIESWNRFVVFGAFYRETDELTGFALLEKVSDDFVDFSVLRTNPDYEKFSVNAAIVCKIMEYYAAFLAEGGMICDGSRSINHETKFQSYLEKYFGFRNAYCNLHIAYNPKVKWIIKMLYPFRKVLFKFDNINKVHQINGILKMENIVRRKK